MSSKKIQSPHSIGRSLNFATGRMNALCQKLLEPHQLSLPQWVILSFLWREGELTVGMLADLVGTGLPATSRLVDRMIARDLVARRRHASDRRVIVIKPTKKGSALNHLSDLHEKINTCLFVGFSREEQKLAFDLLTRMQRNAEAGLQEQ